MCIERSNSIEENLLNVTRNSIEENEPIERHRRAQTRQIFDTNLLEKSDNLLESDKKTKGSNLDNKFMSLFSPKNSTSLKFSKNKSKGQNNQFERLCSSLEVIFKNVNSLSINLPIIYEADKTDKKLLDNKIVNTFDNGNYLFIFLDEKIELLFGLVMNSSGGKNFTKFFKRTKGSNGIEYSDCIEGLSFDVEKNIFKQDKHFSFNLSSYVFMCSSMKLMSFLCYKKDKANVMLYDNISYIKIYDMC
jgi:hypothetical protein